MKTKLYIMQAGDFIKVGVTSNSIKERAKQVQTGCPLPIEEILYCEFETKALAYMAETDVHKELSIHNSYGEWFFKFSKYTTKICKIIGKDTSDIKTIRSVPKELFQNTRLAKKRRRYRLMSDECIDMTFKNPNLKDEIKAHYKLTDTERQKKIEKAIKNNPLLKGFCNG